MKLKRILLHPASGGRRARSALGVIGLLVVAVWSIGAKGSGPADGATREYLATVSRGKTFWGEPYELAGNRIFFTDWYFIQPGNLSWENRQGERINEAEERSKDPVYDEWAAQLSHPSSPHGIRIVVQPAQRVGPVLQREKPWESGSVIFKTVLRNGDRYQAWGKCEPGGDCYFESKDGVHWERPALGQVEFNGSRDNNLLKPGPTGQVFIDPHAPPEERYKSVGGQRVSLAEFQAFVSKHPDRWETRVIRGSWDHPETFYCLRGAVSPDGIHWKELPEPFTIEHSDGMETGYYDATLGKYVIYTRTYLVGPRSPRWNGDIQQRTWVGESHGSGRRVVGRTESPTFGDFPLSEPVIVPVPEETSPSEEFYTSIHTTLPGAPDEHLMFPTVWETRDDTTSIGVWSSHDGRLWSRIPGPPVLTTAPFGAWDGGCIFSFPGLIELPNGDFALPYKGYNLPHKYPRGKMELYAGYAVWPKGRLVAVQADDVGEFATVGILPPGHTLKINAVTKRAGGIRVELCRINDQVVAGRTFSDCDIVQGDAFWKTVTWKGESDLKTADGEALVIRVRIERGQLFGIEFD
ncbi:MAG TPA: hypothetical protein VMD08_13850 [Candidatus Baltobacteraceae bacterium]|nr:hypothetical protein [Candidatus Baltobacteraceae bacterium]